MEFILTKPRMPKVDGKSHDTPCQKAGMLLCGHDTHDMKRSMTEEKTTRSITFSR